MYICIASKTAREVAGEFLRIEKTSSVTNRPGVVLRLTTGKAQGTVRLTHSEAVRLYKFLVQVVLVGTGV